MSFSGVLTSLNQPFSKNLPLKTYTVKYFLLEIAHVQPAEVIKNGVTFRRHHQTQCW